MKLSRTLLALLAGSLLAVSLMACGDDGPTEAAGADTDTETASATESGGPVTIEHKYGSTTFEETPQRIVSLDAQWTDVLVALDAPLVGNALSPNAADGLYPWQEVPDDVEDITATDSIPFEAIAALRPDMIVITYFLTDEADYEKLSQIAPTIPLLTDEQVDKWQDIATAAGEILGAEDEAAQLIDDADQLAADVLEDLPGLEGRTYALANYVPGDGIYVVADPDDGAGTFFSQIGLQIDPDLLAIADGANGRVKLSLERIGELDADLLVMLTNGTDTADIAGYETLPAVQDGAVAILDTEDVTGLNTPSPLSIPYVLEFIRPALEAAAS